MPLNDDQKRALLTNLARDKAEHLRDEIHRLARETAQNDHGDLSDAQRALGEYALRRAMESVQRMVENLEQALKIAQRVAEGEVQEQEGWQEPEGLGWEEGR